MIRTSWLFPLVALAGLVASACMDTLEPDVGELTAGVCKNDDTDPDQDVSFRAEIFPMVQLGCGCHDPTKSGSAIDSTGFSIGDYGAIRRGGSNSRDQIVVTGDPCNSFLYQKLADGPPTGARMPTSGPYWSRSDMALLHDWIAEGAHAE
jgi:hypothetical protein